MEWLVVANSCLEASYNTLYRLEVLLLMFDRHTVITMETQVAERLVTRLVDGNGTVQ